MSPFVTSESEGSHGYNYLTKGRASSPRPFAKARTRSGKWKQDGLGWSLVESPLLKPFAQSTNDPPTRQVSVKELEDKLLVVMPGVDNPESENPTDQQVWEHQEQMAIIRRKEGSDAIVDPDTFPSPRHLTPEGPSTPPNRLYKMFKRKKVGSGTHARDDSTDTVLVNEQNRAEQNRSRSRPTPRKGVREQQRVRIVTPSNIPRELSLDTGMGFRDPFLGQPPRPPDNQTLSVTQFQYPQSRPREAARRQSPPPRPSPSKEGRLVPPAIPTLSQCLPQIHLQHPSAFANLESPSYRRPNQLLPARLRPLDQKKRLVEDACTSISTFTTTSFRKPEKDQRPRMQRQDGRIVVPRAVQLPQESELSKENHLQAQAGTPTQRQLGLGLSTNFMGRSQDSITKLPPIQTSSPEIKARVAEAMTATQGLSPESETRTRERPQNSAKRVQSLGAESAARMAWFPKSPTKTQGLSLGSANVIRGPAQKSQRNGAGTTHTCDHPGNEPAEFTVCSDGSTWFAGHWAEADENDGVLESVPAMKYNALVRRRSVGEKMADAKLWTDALEDRLRVSTKLSYVRQLVCEMLDHVLRTLHPSSPALQVLSMPNVTAQDYLIALKDLILAGVYLLVLLNVLMIVRKVVILVTRFLYWFCHPLNTVLVVLRWCIMS